MSIVTDGLQNEATELDEELSAITGEDNDDSPSIPEKFKGKSLEEVAKSYVELEKRLGDHAAELGTLRKFTDNFIKKELEQADEPEDDPITYDDLLENPTEAIKSTIESNPRIKELEDKIANSERLAAQSVFEQKHPDFQDVVSDSQFQEWISKSKVRTALYQQADNFNFDAADELLSTWKERQSLIKGAAKTSEAETKRKNDLKSATTESGSPGVKGVKTFSRTELIHKRMTDPAWYEAHQEEIIQAYQLGNLTP